MSEGGSVKEVEKELKELYKLVAVQKALKKKFNEPEIIIEYGVEGYLLGQINVWDFKEYSVEQIIDYIDKQ